METDYQECLAVAERAAEWVILLPEATLDERREFLSWLRESPLHVREFLLAAQCKDLIDQCAPLTDVDASALLQRASQGVVSFPDRRRSAKLRAEHLARDERGFGTAEVVVLVAGVVVLVAVGLLLLR